MEIWPSTLVMIALIWWEYLYECVGMMESGVMKLQCVYVSNLATQLNGLIQQTSSSIVIMSPYIIINGLSHVTIIS